ncbi:MAG TPA: DUF2171 domain-containing protein [Thermomicrobiaceae bacterium]|nr:DUF2171 domain-containing protein [Thermomicrobiaceae bacterium]
MVYRDFREIRNQMRVGMPVVGDDGERVGTVKEMLGQGFRVDRSLEPDITVSYNQVETVNKTGVMLNVAGGDANVAVDPGAPLTRPPHAP